MAITHSYVDFGAGNDATGDGTIGTPWKTLQKAFDTLTRNTTDGNQVNLKAGTAHVNAAELDLTTFVAGGALSVTAPLIIRGYTSAANDGGIGEIDCGGATMFLTTGLDFVILVNLECHTFGDNNGVTLHASCLVFRCEVHKGASSPSGKRLVNVNGAASAVVGCYIHDQGAGTSWGVFVAAQSSALFNYVVADSGVVSGYCVQGGRGSVIVGNVITAASTTTVGVTGAEMIVVNNTVYNSTAAITSGISNTASTYNLAITLNNIIDGWSGAGGEGATITNAYLVGYNAFYNNTATYTNADQLFTDLTANDVALAADPFTDAASGDFSLTAAAKTALAAKGFPLAYLGAHANTVSNLNIGPIQMAASSGGGVNMPRVRVGH